MRAETSQGGSRISVSNRVLAGVAEARGTRLGLRSAALMLGLVGSQFESGPGNAGAAHDAGLERGDTWVASIILPRESHLPARFTRTSPHAPRGKHD